MHDLFLLHVNTSFLLVSDWLVQPEGRVVVEGAPNVRVVDRVVPNLVPGPHKALRAEVARCREARVLRLFDEDRVLLVESTEGEVSGHLERCSDARVWRCSMPRTLS